MWLHWRSSDVPLWVASKAAPWLLLHSTGQSLQAICLILKPQSLSVTEAPVASPGPPRLSEQPESTVGKEAAHRTEGQFCLWDLAHRHGVDSIRRLSCLVTSGLDLALQGVVKPSAQVAEQ